MRLPRRGAAGRPSGWHGFGPRPQRPGRRDAARSRLHLCPGHRRSRGTAGGGKPGDCRCHQATRSRPTGCAPSGSSCSVPAPRRCPREPNGDPRWLHLHRHWWRRQRQRCSPRSMAPSRSTPRRRSSMTWSTTSSSPSRRLPTGDSGSYRSTNDGVPAEEARVLPASEREAEAVIEGVAAVYGGGGEGGLSPLVAAGFAATDERVLTRISTSANCRGIARLARRSRPSRPGAAEEAARALHRRCPPRSSPYSGSP